MSVDMATDITWSTGQPRWSHFGQYMLTECWSIYIGHYVDQGRGAHITQDLLVVGAP